MKPRALILAAVLGWIAAPRCLSEEGAISTSLKQFLQYAEAESFKGVVDQQNDGKGKRDWTPDAWNRVALPFASGGQILVNLSQKSVATYAFNAPDTGTYYIWVLHMVNPMYYMTFNCVIEQRDQTVATLEYATELPDAKRSDSKYIYRPGYWHVWSMQPVQLERGDVKISLTANKKANTAVEVDAILILGDPDLTPEFTGVPFPLKTRPKMVGNNMTRLITPKDKADRDKEMEREKEKKKSKKK